jgi:hypothetical protein
MKAIGLGLSVLHVGRAWLAPVVCMHTLYYTCHAAARLALYIIAGDAASIGMAY